MYNILITDGIEKDAARKLRELDFNVIEEFYEKDVLGDKLKDVDVLVVRSATKVTKDVIDKALEGKKLKLIVRGGVGLDNIDVKYAEANGIKVMNTPNASSISVAELTIGQLFVLARFINTANVTMRDGKWEKKKYKGTEINGKTLGLVGFGRIAKEVAKRAELLGMNVIYTDIMGEAQGFNKYRFCDMEEVLQKADFLSLHIPFDKNKGAVITEKEINKMKDGAYLINCARGGLVDEKDLLKALDEGKLSAAAIDVYEQEPTLNLDLVNHPRVSPTPHIGASTVEAQERIGEEIVNVIQDYFLDFNNLIGVAL
ncbi:MULTISPECIES: D-2-hydroxyacid dehydrogenase [unclassified Clostridioides]|uniref:D-2-hydroxyacid dehydrogenase n=1 Tax=unclassified Clostridioides TaxID=2635829 RepID=UPI001D11CA36|nr:D-2-hydroxyacid dehydrogenase [Clostridioides sp. ZZV14-6150]MCC0662087.1 D-2-hydroxyacid dehydrogenase [Clostridioides sp. ZZV14-6154]MCC0669876.1 D-2-hydroxyacid dehydrogenase [Clostridioides sp. ZZV14-6153]MCC0719778.1 D-2-hydroxyacid dehydrogenase [Clostridioides sp. ZZV14-6105]MCC0722152.1 D-2-hydroxyacid dehydrogenase [Clostridioides sp. ZZV14-6104]MCC0728241.1 D-2-hydroxyacid dehydrogenase [Clostridioides sp. ZZV14-6045]MCC0732193.1 D-2-hydroxyacid dehydrogenase [Clostridioides sp. 